jgi:hypothetical protein
VQCEGRPYCTVQREGKPSPPRTDLLVPPRFWRGFFFGPQPSERWHVLFRMPKSMSRTTSGADRGQPRRQISRGRGDRQEAVHLSRLLNLCPRSRSTAPISHPLPTIGRRHAERAPRLCKFLETRPDDLTIKSMADASAGTIRDPDPRQRRLSHPIFLQIVTVQMGH